jgi:hypothetical protein
MSEREVRIGRTEAMFRNVNELIATSARRFDAHESDFVCECADAGCAERVRVTLDEYEHVRADGTRFLVVAGHEDTRVERVVARPHRRLAVIEKFNSIVARVVRRLNPRTDPV